MPEGYVPKVPDKRTNPPTTLADKRSLIRLVYRWNEWDKAEHKTNCEMIGLEVKRIDDYSEAELDVFLRDFEKHKMMIYL